MAKKAKKKTSDKVSLTIRLTPELVHRLDMLAEQENRSRTAQVEYLIAQHISKLAK